MRRAWSARSLTAFASSACMRPTAVSSTRPSTRASWPGSSACCDGCARTASPSDALVLGGDMNIAPADIDVWDARAVHGGTHVSPPERDAFNALAGDGVWSTATDPSDPNPAASPGGTTAPATSTRTWACASTTCCITRARRRAAELAAEIDREARKGMPVPSDHAPLFIDLDAARRQASTRAGRARCSASPRTDTELSCLGIEHRAHPCPVSDRREFARPGRPIPRARQ